jgi:chemotaxis protein methyltransferase CheR
VIFCRNVLMYFTKPQAGAVVEKLARCLVAGGFLVPSASEASPQLFAPLRTIHWPRVILYKKDGAPNHASAPRPLVRAIRPELAPPPPARKPVSPTKPAVDTAKPEAQAENPAQWHERARKLANEGQLADALFWCGKAVAAEKMNARHHYLRASILMEQNGSDIEAEQSLRRSIYLEPDFALAHFALGNLARRRGDLILATRSFNTALRLLAQQDPQQLLPESKNLTAGHLADVIAHTLQALSK